MSSGTTASPPASQGASRPTSAGRRYLVVSPVKDEARFVEQTLLSVARQTLPPARWIIVDDGSTDDTPAILRKFSQGQSWIDVVTRESRAARQPGSAVMNAFFHGLARADLDAYDYVVKLDCDVELPEDYFERLIDRFERQPRLGIASGVYLEDGTDGWHAIAMPPYHAAGASKVIRTACFCEIGGFVRERGWDTVDELRAQVRGWTTGHFDDIRFRHLKPEGSGIGNLRTSAMHGDAYYLTGGGTLFLLFKAGHRMVSGSPPVISGLAMLWGYLRCLAARRPRLVDDNEARHYRRLLNGRLWSRLRPLRRRSAMRSMESR